SAMPESMPLLFRISAVEYAEGGYDLEYSTELCRRYREAGVDMFHVSSGGEAPPQPGRGPNAYPGYQLPMARTIKRALDVPVIAVGMLDDPKLAEHAVASGDADLVAVARGMLRDPYWAIHALQATGRGFTPPKQYVRGFA